MSAIGFFEQLAPRFDQEAIEAIPGYLEFWSWVESWFRVRFGDRAGLERGEFLRVLHLGCATGKGLEVARNALGAHKVHLSGIDGSPRMLDLARKRVPEAGFCCFDLEHGLPVTGYDHDVVFLCWILQFTENRGELLRDVLRYTGRPGWVFLCEKNEQTDVEKVAYMIWRRRVQSAWYVAHKSAHLADIMKTIPSEAVLSEIAEVAPDAQVSPIYSILGFNSWLVHLPEKVNRES